MKGVIKRASLAFLDQPVVGGWLGRMLPNRCVILMLHRFETPDGDHLGHDPARLRGMLSYLRRSRIALLDVDDAVSRFAKGPAARADAPPAVSFTVDDGYADLLEVAAPIFAEFDCPVTGFVVPEVVDGMRWFWWDQIDWILRHAARPMIQTELSGRPLLLEWGDTDSRWRVHRELCETLKRVPNAERLSFLDALSQVADVPLPVVRPAAYRVLSWDEMRAAERRGVRFGAHSMTHPVLSRCDDVQAAAEILDSWSRVRAELQNPSALFCYPNGTAADFREREMGTVQQAGMCGALSAIPGVLRGDVAAEWGPQWRWRVPRFSYDDRRGVIARSLFL